jgi:hypothetical protein
MLMLLLLLFLLSLVIGGLTLDAKDEEEMRGGD